MDKGSEYYQRYLSGDPEGMNLLIRDYSDGLMLFLNSYVHDMNTAEELMMDTFVRLGVKKPRDKGKCFFKTWLYTIGRNIAVDYLRSHKVNFVGLEEIPEVPASQQSSPEEHILANERNAAIRRAMDHINPDYCHGLWLFYFEEMSTKDISRVTGRTVHATELMLSRARKALRDELIKEGYDDENL